MRGLTATSDRRPQPVRDRLVGALLGMGASLLALLLGTPVQAQDQVRVRAQADRLEMMEGEDLRLVVEISGPSLDRAGPPDLSDLGDFTLSGGPSVSTRFQWINGVSTSSKTYTYALTPNKTGKATIPALALLVQGHTYRTAPIEIEVQAQGTVRSPYKPPAPTPNLPGGGGSGGGAGPAPGGGRSGGPAAQAALRVRAEVDHKQAFVGEQITLKVVLDTQSEILSHGPYDNPTFPGFWAEEIKLPERTEVRRVSIDAEPWYEITLMKRALFPTTSGTLTIPPIAWQVQVRRRSSDPFESFFFTPTETVTRRSDPITVQVQGLPPAGRPANFSGAVGQFDLQVSADRDASRVNDAVGVKVKVAGKGNLGSAGAPPIGDLADFKTFDPKVTSTTSLDGDRLKSEKTWDYVVIPLAPGSQTLPPIGFSYFDPDAKAYRSLASKPLTIQVAKADGSAGATGLSAVAQSDVRLLRRDIHYLKTAPDGLRDRSRPFHRTPLFAALCALPLLADVGLWAWARTRDDSPQAARGRRERRARAVARRRLRTAHRLMKSSTARPFYASVAQALTEYVGDKFGTPGVGLTHERIEALLAEGGVPDEQRAAFHRTLEACDFARFAPSSSDEQAMRRTFSAAEEALSGLERSLA